MTDTAILDGKGGDAGTADKGGVDKSGDAGADKGGKTADKGGKVDTSGAGRTLGPRGLLRPLRARVSPAECFYKKRRGIRCER